ncbi:MAG: hypothetical protein HQ513_15510 [Rhodospirillales bacterium]|nr:hypothetical protein [Rhodospirillales bacterium]
MDIQTLTAFFKWCTIINGALLVFSIALFILLPDFIFAIHGGWFPMPRETFNAIIYASIGMYKVLFLIFNLAPYVALLIINRKTVSD